MIVKRNLPDNIVVPNRAALENFNQPKYDGLEVFILNDSSYNNGLTKNEWVQSRNQWFTVWSEFSNSITSSVIVNEELIFVQGSNIYQNTSGNYGWRDLQAPFTVRTTNSQNNPSWMVLFNGMQGLGFSANTMNQVWIDFHIDHDYAMGTNLYPHIHWCPTTNDSGVVRWGVEYTVAKGHQQQAFPATTLIYVEQTVQSNQQWVHFVAESSDLDSIAPTNVEPDTVIKIRFFRDAAHPNDTYPATVHAWQGDIHYQTARLSTINKSPNFFG
jgi:hypothetical protein